MAYSRDDALAVLDVIGGGTRLLVLSSMDVYRASQVLRGREGSDESQLDESAPLRRDRYIYRDPDHPDDDYEKLDVEEAYLVRGANVLRLPMAYGEHDRQRREEFILRRVRAGRTAIPIGVADLVWSRGYVVDIGAAARLIIESDVDRDVFNVCETRHGPFGSGRSGSLAPRASPVSSLPSPMPFSLRTCGSHAPFDSTFPSMPGSSEARWAGASPTQ